jgi:hypothetical protein
LANRKLGYKVLQEKVKPYPWKISTSVRQILKIFFFWGGGVGFALPWDLSVHAWWCIWKVKSLERVAFFTWTSPLKKILTTDNLRFSEMQRNCSGYMLHVQIERKGKQIIYFFIVIFVKSLDNGIAFV